MNSDMTQHFQSRVKEAERRLEALATSLNVTMHDLRAYPEKFSDTVRATVATILAEQIFCLKSLIYETPTTLDVDSNVIYIDEWKKAHCKG